MAEIKTDRQRTPETMELLKNLRMKLVSEHISTARVAAYNLAWLQDDGLTILKEALFGDYSRVTKKAAAYGLRNMKGRMKKLAVEVLEQGLTHRDGTTRAASLKSLQLLRGEVVPSKSRSPHKGRSSRPHNSSRRSIQGVSDNRGSRSNRPTRKNYPTNR